jgi:hypothetical protein
MRFVKMTIVEVIGNIKDKKSNFEQLSLWNWNFGK